MTYWFLVETKRKHWQNLQAVLERIQNSGMTLRKDKCEFGKNEIKFLGHIVGSDGIRADPSKIEAITEMKPPGCKNEAPPISWDGELFKSV